MPEPTPRAQLAVAFEEILDRWNEDLGLCFRAAPQGALEAELLDAAEGWRPPARVIETIADLESLPEYSVIRWTAPDGLSRGVIERFDGGWWSPGHHARLLVERIPLPAVVLYTPENGAC